MNRELIVEQSMGDKDLWVYLIIFLKRDIITYVDNPYRYLIEVSEAMDDVLLSETEHNYNKFMKVSIKVNLKLKPNVYRLYKLTEFDFPTLDAWWEYLPLEKKVEIYTRRKNVR